MCVCVCVCVCVWVRACERACVRACVHRLTITDLVYYTIKTLCSTIHILCWYWFIHIPVTRIVDSFSFLFFSSALHLKPLRNELPAAWKQPDLLHYVRCCFLSHRINVQQQRNPILIFIILFLCYFLVCLLLEKGKGLSLFRHAYFKQNVNLNPFLHPLTRGSGAVWKSRWPSRAPRPWYSLRSLWT